MYMTLYNNALYQQYMEITTNLTDFKLTNLLIIY